MADKFDKAVSIVKSLPKDGPVKPTQDDQLQFYSLFKQANSGDVTGDRPGMLSFEARAKWDAWNKRKGMSQDDAKAQYAELLKGVLEKNDSEEAKKYLGELDG